MSCQKCETILNNDNRYACVGCKSEICEVCAQNVGINVFSLMDELGIDHEEQTTYGPDDWLCDACKQLFVLNH